MSAKRSVRGSLANYLLALIAIFSLNFVLPRMMPGDPLQAIYGQEALVAMTPQMEAALIQKFSLDQPWSSQLYAYISGLFEGDLGYSYYFRDQVSAVILGALPWTLILTGSALILATSLGIVLGMESGYRRGGSLDRGLIAGLIFISGFPDFFVGIVLLLIFGVSLGIAPLYGSITPYSGETGLAYLLDILHHLALPLASLVLVQLGAVYLLTRNTMVVVLKERFVLTARAKGCTDRAVRYRHAGRNSLLPVITATGIRLPQLITGALFIEIVFSYPGVGLLLSTALDARDYPLIQGILLLVTVAVLTANCGVDLLYRRLDPRVRHAR
ncbi:MAG: dipeptide transporter permease DppB [Methanosaeta sp. PtaB.Bin039]|nr:MAG: dipeptide transporter permease DppB [Methanosaeta sp. PtaB.Bin039]OPY47746.1 MAG: dipeptide transporter permease DppB [Methanosaeta sp. PtaU1.Bin028]HOT07724.1 ABC transporter permease [Methanotrichaceae archaeon]HQF17420.1 ABC transporter permease [Methanotrichaceae archaeon]HQI92178.1 ABC transporter permease [Methanotrichaceae archaeon]